MTETRKRLNVTFILGTVAAAAFSFGVIVMLVQSGSFERIWHNLVVRPASPFGLRFVVQPVMAAIIACIDGVSDAKTGHQRHFLRPHGDAESRWAQLVEAVRAVANILFLAVILDTVYQLVDTRTFYPFETIVVALLLAVVPYLVVRGPAAWLAGKFIRHPSGASSMRKNDRDPG